MKEGEDAFARRDFEAARKAYKRALTLEPRLYTAALFVADTYFAEGQLRQARSWFARTILIDPDKETAHRYLGDTQMKSGNLALARVSYLNAVLAEPYTRRTWSALAQWAKETGVPLSHPQVIPQELEDNPKSEQFTPVPNDGRSQWRRYAETREARAKSKFKATFPDEKSYRHSLAEESDALRQVARAIAAQVKSGKIKEPHPSFATLIKLDDEGLLEAHVLYARADQGISQDYKTYRSAHRDELRRYLSEYVAPGKGPQTPANIQD
jgi:tetratricopeptide (TPR) repeat protein